MRKSVICAALLLLFPVLSTACSDSDWKTHPILCETLERLEENEAQVVNELHELARASGWIVEFPETELTSTLRRQRRGLQQSSSQLPVVVAHGMGDSCFNQGISSITQQIGSWLNVYSVCIPTGATQTEDTKNGYFLSMDANVDIFANAIFNNPQLSRGFHAIGFSQGNNVIRGYITKYNTPYVHTFLSINGVNAGISALPHCTANSKWCAMLNELASERAYTAFAQEHSFQANYWRDPFKYDEYLKFSQLAVYNNEVSPMNATFNANWSKTQQFVWIKADDDTMVYPPQGEQWGQPDPDDPTKIVPMIETNWYKSDLFGLRTADEQHKNFFEHFPGDHLQFELADLHRWINTYLVA